MTINGILITTCAAVFLCAAAASAEVEVYYFKEKQILTEKPGEIAVLQTTTARSAGTSAPAVARNVPGAYLQPMVISGWWRATIAQPTHTRSAAYIRDAVTSAAANPDVTFVSPVFQNADGGEVIATPTILVQFSEATSPAQAEAVIAAAGAGVILEREAAGIPNAYKIQSTARDAYTLLDIVNSLARRDDVIFAESDMIVSGQSHYVPNDPFFSSAWWLHNTGQAFGSIAGEDIDAPAAWNITKGNANVRVLIIDDGVQFTHPDLNLLPGKDFTDPSTTVNGNPGNNCDRHGTPVAGCVSGKMDNSLGACGIAPLSPAVSARCFVSEEPCTGNWTAQYSWTVNALNWAQQSGIRVTNNSNSYGSASAAVNVKYRQTYQAGMIHFASSGNEGLRKTHYPASIDVVVAVGATNSAGDLAGFSNYGLKQNLTAPGDSIYTTDRTGARGFTGGDYAFMQGTSFASPTVAGVAALMLSVNSTLTAPEVKDILFSTATDKGPTGWDEKFGHGVVNAYRAVRAALQSSAEEWELY